MPGYKAIFGEELVGRVEASMTDDSCNMKQSNIRHHEGKPRWDLLAYDTLWEMAAVMTEGAKKHGERDWEKGVSYNDYFSAAMRHLSAWHLGESMDPQSKHNHLAHAMCDLMIIFANELRHIGEDDRPKRYPMDSVCQKCGNRFAWASVSNFETKEEGTFGKCPHCGQNNDQGYSHKRFIEKYSEEQ